MNDNNIKLWQGVLALSALALVIVSMVYWLNGKLEKETTQQEQLTQMHEQSASFETEIAALKRENSRLKSLPPKEVVVEKECPKAEPQIVTQAAECAPCPDSAATPQAAPDSKTVVTHKPQAVATIVCTKMAIGKWEMPARCLKEIKGFLETKPDAQSDFFVITPIVDTRQYKGKQPELKQAGLGQFRAESAKKELKGLVGPNLYIFQKKTIQKHEMRGFVIELYRIRQAE